MKRLPNENFRPKLSEEAKVSTSRELCSPLARAYGRNNEMMMMMTMKSKMMKKKKKSPWMLTGVRSPLALNTSLLR